MKQAEGIGGRRHVNVRPGLHDYATGTWESGRSMSDQLREERERLFGKGALRVPKQILHQDIAPVTVTPVITAKKPAVSPPAGWLTRKATAEALGVSTWTLENWSHAIKLKYVQVKNPYMTHYYDPEIIKQIQQTEWFTKRAGAKREYHRDRLSDEERRQRRQKYYQKNKEKIRAKNTEAKKKYYHENPEKYKEYQRKYRLRKKYEPENVTHE